MANNADKVMLNSVVARRDGGQWSMIVNAFVAVLVVMLVLVWYHVWWSCWCWCDSSSGGHVGVGVVARVVVMLVLVW